MQRLLIGLLIIVALVGGTLLLRSLRGGSGEPAPEASYTNASPDVIVVTTPAPGEEIASPLTVSGEARGTWYFEATFPIVVVDWDGRIIGQGYAEAQGNWMTEDFVPFLGTVAFSADTSVSDRGAVILQRSNASGLPEHDAAVEVPIVFSEVAPGTRYVNETLGFSLEYPEGYVFVEPEEVSGSEVAVIFYTEADWEDFKNARSAREAPPGVSVEVFPNTDGLSALEWVTREPRSNFALGSGSYTELVVAGVPAVAYDWSGLYEGASVVFASDTRVYMLSATYLSPQDQTIADFGRFVSSFALE